MPLTLPFHRVSKLGRNRVVAAPHQQKASRERRTPPRRAASHVPANTAAPWMTSQIAVAAGNDAKVNGSEQLRENRRVFVQQRTLCGHGS